MWSKIMLVMGSPSDEPKLQKGIDQLLEFAKAVEFRAYPDRESLLEVEIRCLSSHRNPEGVDELIKNINEDPCIDVIIACAGMAAFLPSYIAAKTTIPVIGVPLSGSAMNGFDALCSIAQSPPGVPIAATAVDGIENGILMALRIIGIKNHYVRDHLKIERSSLSRRNDQADKEIYNKYAPTIEAIKKVPATT